MGRIVVGVDGSESSLHALRWAIAEAAFRNDTVEAVISWSYPVVATDGLGGTAALFDASELQDRARQTLESAVAAATSDADVNAAILRTVIEGSAGRALVDASRGAVMLVVGSRGHGGFTGLLLGSVSTQCVHHAHCPVMVIRPSND